MASQLARAKAAAQERRRVVAALLHQKAHIYALTLDALWLPHGEDAMPTFVFYASFSFVHFR